MVKGNSMDELPPGWKEQIKISSGRKIKCYIDPETGKNFYSKKGAIRYFHMKNGMTSSPQPQSCSQSHTVTPGPQSSPQPQSHPQPLPLTVIPGPQSSPQPQSDLSPLTVTPGPQSSPQPQSSPLRKRKSLQPQRSPHSTPLPLSSPQPQNTPAKGGPEMRSHSSGVGEDELATWLPHGWIMEVKIRKSGKDINKPYKIYIDPSTGRKFYSKLEVSRYLQSPGQSKSKEKMSKNDKSSLKKDVSEYHSLSQGQSAKTKKEKGSSGSKPSIEIVQPDVMESRSLDASSVSWIAEFKTTKNAQGIKIDTYYTDPISGYVFRSEKDVLLYLETGDISKCAIEPRKRDENGPDSTNDVNSNRTKERPLWGKNVSGHHLLQNGQSSLSEKKRNSVSNVTGDVVEVPSAEGLPPGWVKEIKTKRTANGIRRDSFYTDHVSGYMFRSKLDALRYIETGDISKCLVRPMKIFPNHPEPTKDVIVASDPASTSNAEVANHPPSSKEISIFSPPVGKRYSLRSVKGQDSVGEKSTDGKENCDMISPGQKAESSKRRKVEITYGDAMVTGSGAVPGAIQPHRTGRKSRKLSQNSEPKPRESEQESIAADNRTISNVVTDDFRGEKPTKIARKKKVTKKTPMASSKQSSRKVQRSRPEKRVVQSHPGRMSKRLAGSEPEMPANLQLSERSLRAAIKKSCEVEEDILSFITMNGASQRLDSAMASSTPVWRPVEVEHNTPPITTMNTTDKGVPDPLDQEPAPAVADIVSMVVQSISKIEESEKDEGPSVKNQAVEEKAKSQADEKRQDGNPKPQNSQGTYPFLDTWSDPCLDFAFKTLTGAIPVNNNPSYQGNTQNHIGTTSQRNEDFRQPEPQRSVSFQNGLPFHPLGPVEQAEARPPSPPPGFTFPLFGSFGSHQRSAGAQGDYRRNIHK